ncbi:unnamed protein product, partial [Prorocentrum cordatum]
SRRTRSSACTAACLQTSTSSTRSGSSIGSRRSRTRAPSGTWCGPIRRTRRIALGGEPARRRVALRGAARRALQPAKRPGPHRSRAPARPGGLQVHVHGQREVPARQHGHARDRVVCPELLLPVRERGLHPGRGRAGPPGVPHLQGGAGLRCRDAAAAARALLPVRAASGLGAALRAVAPRGVARASSPPPPPPRGPRIRARAAARARRPATPPWPPGGGSPECAARGLVFDCRSSSPSASSPALLPPPGPRPDRAAPAARRGAADPPPGGGRA